VSLSLRVAAESVYVHVRARRQRSSSDVIDETCAAINGMMRVFPPAADAPVRRCQPASAYASDPPVQPVTVLGRSAAVETLAREGLRSCAELCAWTLAGAHARSGDRIAMAASLGDDDRLPQAIADFAHSNADLAEQDFATFSPRWRAEGSPGRRPGP
jgi:hypothetical protein